MGFIFWPNTKRFFSDKKINLPKNIKKVGVFVNQDLAFIKEKAKEFNLDFIQLHGNEDLKFCNSVRSFAKTIKVFHIDNNFDFQKLLPFENCVNYFLFDTKCESFGGSGMKFEWDILKKYNLKTSFFLSGGIDIDDLKKILELKKMEIPIFGIDINSKFELRPGLKNKLKIQNLINKLKK
tara:strand:- start:899 stop:1438 length:540 start_codon:yes stop_codon:yes gene_type:complete